MDVFAIMFPHRKLKKLVKDYLIIIKAIEDEENTTNPRSEILRGLNKSRNELEEGILKYISGYIFRDELIVYGNKAIKIQRYSCPNHSPHVVVRNVILLARD